MRQQFQQPLLLITYGYPGSGKSTFAHQFAHQYRMLHISANRIRYELFDDPLFNAAEEQVIIALMNYMTEQALKTGVSCIYDRGAGVKKQRISLVDSATKYGFKSLIVSVQTDKETAFYRSANRDRRRAEDRFSFPIPPQQFDRELTKMTRPGEKEEFVVVSGKHPFRSQSNAVINRLLRMGVGFAQQSERTGSQGTMKKIGRVDPTIRLVRPQDVGRGAQKI